MFSDSTAFCLFLVISCGFAAWFGHRHGKETLLPSGMAASMLAGTWFEIEAFGTAINVTMATAGVWLTVFCLHSGRQIFANLGLLDYLVALMMACHVFVDTYFGATFLATAIIAYGQWMLPYVAGRYSFLEPRGLQKSGPVFAVVAMLMGLAATVEALTGFNVWADLICGVDDDVEFAAGMRLGLHRAQGPCRHAIFLGVVLLSLIPFTVEWLIRHDVGKVGRWVAVACLIATVSGIVATVSRGPIACLPMLVVFALIYRYRWFRWAMAGVSIAAVVFLATRPDDFVKFLELASNPNQRSRVVVLDGSEDAVLQTGTRNRYLAPQVYGPIFLRGGLLGYGSEASSGFPPRDLPGAPTDPQVLESVSIIDNSYLNIGLAFGYVGLLLFLAMLVASIAVDLSQVRTAGTYFPSTSEHFFLIRAATLSVMILQIALVYWDYDHAFWVLAFVGGTASFAARRHRCLLGQI